MSLLTNPSSTVVLSELPAVHNCDPAVLLLAKMDSIDPLKELARELEHHKKRKNSFPLDRSHPIEIRGKQMKELTSVQLKKV